MNIGISANFNLDARLTSQAAHERLFRARVLEEAQSLFMRDGVGAVSFVQRELRQPGLDAGERRYRRLVVVEIERLDRDQRQDFMLGRSTLNLGARRTIA